MTRRHAVCEDLLLFPNLLGASRACTWGVKRASVRLMSTLQKPRGGPREHVIYEGLRAHAIFVALVCTKCVEEVRMTISVGQ